MKFSNIFKRKKSDEMLFEKGDDFCWNDEDEIPAAPAALDQENKDQDQLAAQGNVQNNQGDESAPKKIRNKGWLIAAIISGGLLVGTVVASKVMDVFSKFKPEGFVNYFKGIFVEGNIANIMLLVMGVLAIATTGFGIAYALSGKDPEDPAVKAKAKYQAAQTAKAKAAPANAAPANAALANAASPN